MIVIINDKRHTQKKETRLKYYAILTLNTYTNTLVFKNSALFVYRLTLLLEMTFHVEIDASEIFCGKPGAYCSI